MSIVCCVLVFVCLDVLPGHTDAVVHLEFIEHKRMLISGSRDSRVKVRHTLTTPLTTVCDRWRLTHFFDSLSCVLCLSVVAIPRSRRYRQSGHSAVHSGVESGGCRGQRCCSVG